MARQCNGETVIIGAGRMGRDIAIAFALAGWDCQVAEISSNRRDEAAYYWKTEAMRLGGEQALKKLSCRTRLEDCRWPAVDLVIEAVTEDLPTKHRVLLNAERLASDQAIFATNTSGLKITDVAKVLGRPDRAVGMHFGVPAHILPAVEVTRGLSTSDETLDTAIKWLEQLGKVPVVIQRDISGQIINRLQHAMYREIYHLIDEGVATPRDIDRAVRFGFGLKYSIAGPVASRDIHGLPVHLATASLICPTLHNGSEPGKVLRDLVDQGHEGVRTGHGFYDWPADTRAARLEQFSLLMEEQVKRIRRLGDPLDF